MIADPFHVIAHRGASAYAPENTMAAFRKALELGVPEVETDVRFTKDKRLVLFHDRTLERTTDGAGPPSDHTLEELKQLDAGSWMDPSEYEGFEWRENYSGERLITLEELLDVFGDSFVYHIEIKDRTEGLVAAVIDCIRSRGLIDKVYIYILNEEAHLFEAKQLEPKVLTALAPKRQLEEQGTQAIEAVARRGHDMVVFSALNHRREFVDLAHRLSIEARSSGIRNREDMIEAVEIGCNGMTINWPDWLLDYLGEQK